MNKIKDKIMKEFLENNAYFVDFFNIRSYATNSYTAALTTIEAST